MTTVTATRPAGNASALKKLYFTRFGFAVVWAALISVVGSHVGPLSVALIVLYPLFDVAAAIVDARSSRSTGTPRGLYLNITISSLTAIGLVIALTSGIPAVLRVWGVWAVVAGIIQLFVALSRRKLGGQWAMIASGSISVLAGIKFFMTAAAGGQSLGTVAGYAAIGGIFFLVSAVRLHLASKGN